MVGGVIADPTSTSACPDVLCQGIGREPRKIIGAGFSFTRTGVPRFDEISTGLREVDRATGSSTAMAFGL